MSLRLILILTLLLPAAAGLGSGARRRRSWTALSASARAATILMTCWPGSARAAPWRASVPPRPRLRARSRPRRRQRGGGSGAATTTRTRWAAGAGGERNVPVNGWCPRLQAAICMLLTPLAPPPSAPPAGRGHAQCRRAGGGQGEAHRRRVGGGRDHDPHAGCALLCMPVEGRWKRGRGGGHVARCIGAVGRRACVCAPAAPKAGDGYADGLCAVPLSTVPPAPPPYTILALPAPWFAGWLQRTAASWTARGSWWRARRRTWCWRTSWRCVRCLWGLWWWGAVGVAFIALRLPVKLRLPAACADLAAAAAAAAASAVGLCSARTRRGPRRARPLARAPSRCGRRTASGGACWTSTTRRRRSR